MGAEADEQDVVLALALTSELAHVYSACFGHVTPWGPAEHGRRGQRYSGCSVTR